MKSEGVNKLTYIEYLNVCKYNANVILT